MSRLKDLYNDTIVEAMTKKFGYKNVMEVPKLDKIVINMGVGEAKDNAKALESAVKDLETITGQHVVLQGLKTPSLTSKSEKVWQSDVKQPSAVRKCMIFLTVL